MKDNLDSVLRDLTFKDNWRNVALREGIFKGTLTTCLIFSIFFSILTWMYMNQIFINTPDPTACYTTAIMV